MIPVQVRNTAEEVLIIVAKNPNVVPRVMFIHHRRNFLLAYLNHLPILNVRNVYDTNGIDLFWGPNRILAIDTEDPPNRLIFKISLNV